MFLSNMRGMEGDALRGGGVDGGVPMSHVDYNKWQCRPVDFKKTSCHPVDFKKVPCRPVDFKKIPCSLSLRPQKGRVAVSILVVHTPIKVGTCMQWCNMT